MDVVSLPLSICGVLRWQFVHVIRSVLYYFVNSGCAVLGFVPHRPLVVEAKWQSAAG